MNVGKVYVLVANYWVIINVALDLYKICLARFIALSPLFGYHPMLHHILHQPLVSHYSHQF